MVVFPGRTLNRDFVEVIHNCAKFGRKAFGSASSMQVRRAGGNYIVEVLSEGHPVQDDNFVEYMRASWDRFFTNGFGAGTRLNLTAKLMAGPPGYGGPADQLVILPSIRVETLS